MRLLLVLPLALCLKTAPPARGWNDVGHMAVARVAYREMDDGLKVRVDKLLRAHPHYEEYLANNAPAGVSAPEWAFVRAATWPDWVRPRKDDPRGERVTKYHRPTDHYANLPIVAAAEADLFHVIAADLDALGQLRPGDEVGFRLVSEDEAEAAAARRREALRKWLRRIAVAIG